MRLVAVVMLVGVAACRPAGPSGPARTGAPPTGREATLGGREPRVRVGLVVDSSAAVLSATSRFDILQTGSDNPLLTADSGAVVTLRANEMGALTATSAGRTTEPSISPLIIRPRGGSVLVSGRP